MSLEREAIFEAALALSESDRALLIEHLIETISPEQLELTEEEFLAELDRCRDEMERGLDPGIPWSELKEQG